MNLSPYSTPGDHGLLVTSASGPFDTTTMSASRSRNSFCDRHRPSLHRSPANQRHGEPVNGGAPLATPSLPLSVDPLAAFLIASTADSPEDAVCPLVVVRRTLTQPLKTSTDAAAAHAQSDAFPMANGDDSVASIVSVNPLAVRLLGYDDASSLVGRSFENMFCAYRMISGREKTVAGHDSAAADGAGVSLTSLSQGLAASGSLGLRSSTSRDGQPAISFLTVPPPSLHESSSAQQQRVSSTQMLSPPTALTSAAPTPMTNDDSATGVVSASTSGLRGSFAITKLAGAIGTGDDAAGATAESVRSLDTNRPKRAASASHILPLTEIHGVDDLFADTGIKSIVVYSLATGRYYSALSMSKATEITSTAPTTTGTAEGAKMAATTATATVRQELFLFFLSQIASNTDSPSADSLMLPTTTVTNTCAGAAAGTGARGSDAPAPPASGLQTTPPSPSLAFSAEAAAAAGVAHSWGVVQRPSPSLPSDLSSPLGSASTSQSRKLTVVSSPRGQAARRWWSHVRTDDRHGAAAAAAGATSGHYDRSSTAATTHTNSSTTPEDRPLSLRMGTDVAARIPLASFGNDSTALPEFSGPQSLASLTPAKSATSAVGGGRYASALLVPQTGHYPAVSSTGMAPGASAGFSIAGGASSVGRAMQARATGVDTITIDSLRTKMMFMTGVRHVSFADDVPESMLMNFVLFAMVTQGVLRKLRDMNFKDMCCFVNVFKKSYLALDFVPPSEIKFLRKKLGSTRAARQSTLHSLQRAYRAEEARQALNLAMARQQQQQQQPHGDFTRQSSADGGTFFEDIVVGDPNEIAAPGNRFKTVASRPMTEDEDRPIPLASCLPEELIELLVASDVDVRVSCGNGASIRFPFITKQRLALLDANPQVQLSAAKGLTLFGVAGANALIEQAAADVDAPLTKIIPLSYDRVADEFGRFQASLSTRQSGVSGTSTPGARHGVLLSSQDASSSMLTTTSQSHVSGVSAVPMSVPMPMPRPLSIPRVDTNVAIATTGSSTVTPLLTELISDTTPDTHVASEYIRPSAPQIAVRVTSVNNSTAAAPAAVVASPTRPQPSRGKSELTTPDKTSAPAPATVNVDDATALSPPAQQPQPTTTTTATSHLLNSPEDVDFFSPSPQFAASGSSSDEEEETHEEGGDDDENEVSLISSLSGLEEEEIRPGQPHRPHTSPHNHSGKRPAVSNEKKADEATAAINAAVTDGATTGVRPNADASVPTARESSAPAPLTSLPPLCVTAGTGVGAASQKDNKASTATFTLESSSAREGTGTLASASGDTGFTDRVGTTSPPPPPLPSLASNAVGGLPRVLEHTLTRPASSPAIPITSASSKQLRQASGGSSSVLVSGAGGARRVGSSESASLLPPQSHSQITVPSTNVASGLVGTPPVVPTSATTTSNNNNNGGRPDTALPLSFMDDSKPLPCFTPVAAAGGGGASATVEGTADSGLLSSLAFTTTAGSIISHDMINASSASSIPLGRVMASTQADSDRFPLYARDASLTTGGATPNKPGLMNSLLSRGNSASPSQKRGQQSLSSHTVVSPATIPATIPTTHNVSALSTGDTTGTVSSSKVIPLFGGFQLNNSATDLLVRLSTAIPSEDTNNTNTNGVTSSASAGSPAPETRLGSPLNHLAPSVTSYDGSLRLPLAIAVGDKTSLSAFAIGSGTGTGTSPVTTSVNATMLGCSYSPYGGLEAALPVVRPTTTATTTAAAAAAVATTTTTAKLKANGQKGQDPSPAAIGANRAIAAVAAARQEASTSAPASSGSQRAPLSGTSNSLNNDSFAADSRFDMFNSPNRLPDSDDPLSAQEKSSIVSGGTMIMRRRLHLIVYNTAEREEIEEALGYYGHSVLFITKPTRMERFLRAGVATFDVLIVEWCAALITPEIQQLLLLRAMSETVVLFHVTQHPNGRVGDLPFPQTDAISEDAVVVSPDIAATVFDSVMFERTRVYIRRKRLLHDLLDVRLRHSYQIIRQIGSGAFGDVFEVVMYASRGRLAMKRIFLKNVKLTVLEQLNREVMIISSLDHPNIISFSHARLEENTYSIFMELGDGTLAQRLQSPDETTAFARRQTMVSGTASAVAVDPFASLGFQPGVPRQSFGGATSAAAAAAAAAAALVAHGGSPNAEDTSVLISPHEAILIIHDVTSGLAYLHHRDIIHRDIKPDNVLFAAGVAKIADFGSATRVSEKLRLTNMRGTLSYMSPEVMLGERYSKPCDIWSLGCLIADIIGLNLGHLSGLHVPAMVELYKTLTNEDCLPITITNRTTDSHMENHYTDKTTQGVIAALTEAVALAGEERAQEKRGHTKSHHHAAAADGGGGPGGADLHRNNVSRSSGLPTSSDGSDPNVLKGLDAGDKGGASTPRTIHSTSLQPSLAQFESALPSEAASSQGSQQPERVFSQANGNATTGTSGSQRRELLTLLPISEAATPARSTADRAAGAGGQSNQSISENTNSAGTSSMSVPNDTDSVSAESPVRVKMLCDANSTSVPAVLKHQPMHGRQSDTMFTITESTNPLGTQDGSLGDGGAAMERQDSGRHPRRGSQRHRTVTCISTSSVSVLGTHTVQLPASLVELFEGIFCRDPCRRMTVDDVLNHPVTWDVEWMTMVRAELEQVATAWPHYTTHAGDDDHEDADLMSLTLSSGNDSDDNDGEADETVHKPKEGGGVTEGGNTNRRRSSGASAVVAKRGSAVASEVSFVGSRASPGQYAISPAEVAVLAATATPDHFDDNDDSVPDVDKMATKREAIQNSLSLSLDSQAGDDNGAA